MKTASVQRIVWSRAVLAVGVLLFVAPIASAQSAPSVCSATNTRVFFGNGVLNDRIKAKLNLTTLQDALSATMATSDYEQLDFQLSFNATGGAIADLFESSIQDIASDISSFWRFLGAVVPMPTSFRERLVNAAAGKKVVLVAHSQGNFFANEAYGNLAASERQSFGIVSVANPDSFVAGGGPYTTLFEDLVIAAVRAVKIATGGPQPLFPNSTNFLTFNDLSGHGFSESYLAGASSSASITSDFSSVWAALTQPTGTGASGIITVTLTWGSQPDVDLHTFEPNGPHVYYAYKVGPSGSLDVDDVTGFGPEHYTVGCETLEQGTYRVGVNYYNGSAPEVANVVIAAGLQVRGFSIFLSNAVGSSGNSSPVPVGDIVVTVNETGEFVLAVN
jgi:hypothetical protein